MPSSWSWTLDRRDSDGPVKGSEPLVEAKARFVIAFRFGCSRFDSVPVLEWIVITGSLDWASTMSVQPWRTRYRPGVSDAQSLGLRALLLAATLLSATCTYPLYHCIRRGMGRELGLRPGMCSSYGFQGPEIGLTTDKLGFISAL